MYDAVAVHGTVEPSWCDIFKGTQPFVGPLASSAMVARDPVLGVLRNLRFRNPDDFRAGSLHAHPEVWERLLSGVSNEYVDLMAVINEGVRVEQFFIHFTGDFKGRSFDSDRPPPIVLENSKSCAPFSDFISSTILQWVSAGVLSVWGEVGRVPPPYLVLPLTVESSKPRLCHDERYLNLWIKDLPFKLDHLSDLPRYVLSGHYQTSFDEKSGYHTFISTRLPVHFSVCNGRVFILLFVHYLLAGRLALSS